MSVYALLGDCWSSERLRKASDAETVGRRSVASKSMILGLLNVAVARPNEMMIEREKRIKERRGDSRDIHTGRGGSLCSIRAVRTRRVDGGIWRDSHCLPYYVTDRMYSLRLVESLPVQSCVDGVAVESADASEPEIMHALARLVGFSRGSTFNATSFRTRVSSHSHSHKPEETSRAGVDIMLYHCCSNIQFVALG